MRNMFRPNTCRHRNFVGDLSDEKTKRKNVGKIEFSFLRSTRFNSAYVVTTNMTCLLRSSKKKKLLIRFKKYRTLHTLTMDIIHQRFGPTDNGKYVMHLAMNKHGRRQRVYYLTPLRRRSFVQLSL